MKTLAEAAMDLPWLAPNVASLTTLARSSLPGIWTQLRADPGFVLLSARVPESSAPLDVALLDAVLQQQSQFHQGFVDWNQSGPSDIHRICYAQALLASQLADKLGCDSKRAWIAGFLTPLGWLAVAAANPNSIANDLGRLKPDSNTAVWQRQAWGHDHTALTRRLCRSWRLPIWLTAILGNIGLHARIAERLGAEPQLFQVVQLSVVLIQEQMGGLGLSVGTDAASLLSELNLNADEVEEIAGSLLHASPPKQAWEPLAQHTLLPDLLQMSMENRRQNDAVWIERLQLDLDHMQDALVQQCANERNRLHTSKLSALAEFAAGAGHEINNPLAVISGQAQYVLKQMDWLDVPAEEIENVGEYLDNLREKVTPSLKKIIGQTQRVHSILTELMQFARPSTPKLQTISVRHLIKDVTASLETLALGRKVQIVGTELDYDQKIHADPTQARAALSRLLRNAIEAAPADGWARIRVEVSMNSMVNLIVDDNGSGPCPTIREHLFDPFFSGRSAGRGRGMGLPTAWRLARQQGGDVRFAGIIDGVTRFVLTLPLAPNAAPVNGYHTELNGRNGVHAQADAS